MRHFRPKTLPNPLSRVVGRDEQIAEVAQLLAQTRLLTLTGIGGIGKTRLALEVARVVEAQFEEGVFFVELAPVDDESRVIHALLEAIHYVEHSAENPVETLLTTLQEKHALLILDNCEHIIDIAATLIRHLLHHCHQLHILVTSRESFGWPEEVVWPVPTLSLPKKPTSNTRADVENNSACQLFLDRARHVAPHFVLTDDNAATVASICQQLDGIPLAIELAAARLRLFSLTQITDRLKEHFDTVIRGQRAGIARHQTLHAAIDWSFQLLDNAEKALFVSLSVFAGTTNLEAIEHVCASSQLTANQIAPALSSLLEKSLVVVLVEHHERRFKMLETVRQFAAQAIADTQAVARLRTRHLDWYVAVAETNTNANTVDWLRLFDLEQYNFVRALEWAEETSDFVAGWRLAGALADYWLYRGQLHGGIEWYQRLLDDQDDEVAVGAESAYATVLLGAGKLSYHLKAYDAANHYLNHCHEFSHQHHLMAIEAGVLKILGSVAANMEQDTAKAHQQFSASLELYRQLDDLVGVGAVLGNLAVLYARDEQHEQAEAIFQESIDNLRQVNAPQQLAFALYNLAGHNLRHGEHHQAARHLIESVTISWQSGNVWLLSYLLEAIAVSCLTWDLMAEAALFFGAAAANREHYGIVDPNAATFDVKPFHEQCKAQLGAEKFAEMWGLGAGESSDVIVERALKILNEQLHKHQSAQTPQRKNAYGLTPREIEVLSLVATGLSDAQVAQQLVISPRTVHRHLSSVYRKLEVDSRTAATRLALEQEAI